VKTAIWWLRRDLRLGDNQALAAALQQAEVVIPVFILDERLICAPTASQTRLGFLFDGLRSLDQDLKTRGSALVVRQGDPVEALGRLMGETGAGGIFAEADVTPFARQRDQNVGAELPLTLALGVTVHPPEELKKSDGTPYTVFTPFSRNWQTLPLPPRCLPAPEHLPKPPAITSLEIPELPRQPGDGIFAAGEGEAQGKLLRFTTSLMSQYGTDRDRLDLEGTSRLSPYLRFGMMSARQAAWAGREAFMLAEDPAARRSAGTWLNELAWRDFYAAILYYFPHVLRTAFREEMRQITWREDDAGFTAWAEGRTGYPVVDAGMRQLAATGWMHNRARMITASFLAKDLLVDWRRGERYFMQHLIDGDPAANNGGWQWTAGTGTDAAPYFRVFNPVLQGKKFDPQGDYVRRWVPELSGVPEAYIHTPWEMPSSLQIQVGCVVGKDYPRPIVDHSMARQRVLEAYRRGKK